MAFSAGQMPDSLGIMIACHLEKCGPCRQRAKLYERLGGELLAEAAELEVEAGLLSELLDKLDKPEPAHEAIESDVVSDIRIPKPLRRFVPGPFEQLPWSGFSRNIKEFDLPIANISGSVDYSAKLYKIAAGKELPVHTHKGNEYTLVLEGCFSDKAGNYNQGDFILADPHVIHQPKAADDADCICFAIVDAPLKMTGFFGRMLNPFLR